MIYEYYSTRKIRLALRFLRTLSYFSLIVYPKIVSLGWISKQGEKWKGKLLIASFAKFALFYLNIVPKQVNAFGVLVELGDIARLRFVFNIVILYLLIMFISDLMYTLARVSANSAVIVRDSVDDWGRYGPDGVIDSIGEFKEFGSIEKSINGITFGLSSLSIALHLVRGVLEYIIPVLFAIYCFRMR